jgi:signal peptidase I
MPSASKFMMTCVGWAVSGLLIQSLPLAMAFIAPNHSLRSGFHGQAVGNVRFANPSVSRSTPVNGLWMASGGDDDNVEDPNPGGLNQWSDDTNDKRSFSELGFFEQIREWFASDEGKEDVKTYTVSLGVALLLRLLIIEPRYIPSLSMFPTFEVGDQLAVEKVTKRIRPFSRNEVVVFHPPMKFREIVGDTSRKAKEALIKRIVATEGDKVEVMGGKLFVNGVEQEEPFTAEDAEYDFGPVVVPPGNVLVLGDNRNHSLDGHIWGFLPTENVIGRAVFVYWPPWRCGSTGMF